MPQKFILFLFLNLVFFEVIKTDINIDIDIDIIEKYGKKKINSKKVILITSGFNVGEEIYISITTYDYCLRHELDYSFYEDINDSNKDSLKALSTVYYSSSSSVNSKKTYNFVIEKDDSDGNYLYMIHNCYPPVTIENTEKNQTKSILITVIAIFVSFIVFIIILIIIIVCCCRRCRRTNPYGVVGYHGASLGVSPFAVPPPFIPAVQAVPQPIINVQPIGQNYPPNQNYNANVQYNQINQAQGSEVRMNQPMGQQKYEKLK